MLLLCAHVNTDSLIQYTSCVAQAEAPTRTCAHATLNTRACAFLQALYHLEAALAQHHTQLIAHGLAVSQNPAHTQHVLEQHQQLLQQRHQQQQQQQQQQAGGAKAGKAPEVVGEKAAAQRRKRLGGEPFKLWDFEAAFTKALDQ